MAHSPLLVHSPLLTPKEDKDTRKAVRDDASPAIERSLLLDDSSSPSPSPTPVTKVKEDLMPDKADKADKADEVDKVGDHLPALMGCRNVHCYRRLNTIDEGAYGVVHRAEDKVGGTDTRTGHGIHTHIHITQHTHTRNASIADHPR